MATYLTEQQINAKLVSLAQRVDSTFAKKKDAITKIELLDLVAPLPSGVTDEGKYIVVTYVDHVDGTNEHKEYIKLEVGSGSGIIKFTIQQEMNDYLVSGKATVGDICFLDEKFYEVELDTDGDLAYNELLFLTETDREILDSLEIEEIYNATIPTQIDEIKIKFNGQHLAKEDDLAKLMIDDTISKTDPLATSKTLSAKNIIEMVETISGVDMSIYAKKENIFETSTTYVASTMGEPNALEVIATGLTPVAEQVVIDDVLPTLPTVKVGDYVVAELVYGNALYLEKSSTLYTEILSQFTIEELKEDTLDPDLVTGYVLKYRGKQLFTEDDLAIENIDFASW